LKATSRDKDLESAIRRAVELHGHLGPFLVIGVRIGYLAQKTFKQDTKGICGFLITLTTPPAIPFTCAIDGIQATTRCTVGNQRLRIRNSDNGMFASFKCDSVDQTLSVTVNPGLVKELMRRMSEGVSGEELAQQIVAMPETHVFIVEKS
jgi:formylmethanofuran dehydrogenase subunit E